MPRTIENNICLSSYSKLLYERRSRKLIHDISLAGWCLVCCRSKVDKISDIITGNPTVIKMVVHFTRYYSTASDVTLEILTW